MATPLRLIWRLRRWAMLGEVDEATMRRRVADARVGRLGTVAADLQPHLVPCCFALRDDVVHTAVDDVKAKSTLRLRRLDHVRLHPAVSLLVDHYEEDWSALWWVRLDGRAGIADPGSDEHAEAVHLLAAKYDQYARRPPPGPVISVSVDTWRAWP